MLSMTLEDFTGVARCIVFAGTLEKFSSTLIKDQVVTITGEVVVNERQGEKTSEIRLFEAKPLEGSLDIDLQNLADQTGLYVKISRSTKSDLNNFRRLIQDHPGDHEVFIQMLPESDYLPIPLGMMVKPSDVLCGEIRRLFGKESVDVRSHAEPGAF
jgi:DNA polymerase III alpha subunit